MADENEALLAQYQKMIEVGLHYDRKLWLIPGAGYAVCGIFYGVIFSEGLGNEERLVLGLVNAVMFFGFLLQFIKDRAFQLGNQAALNEIKERLKLAKTSEFAGVQPADPCDRWFIRLTRSWSAANTIVYIMLITLAVNAGFAICFVVSVVQKMAPLTTRCS